MHKRTKVKMTFFVILVGMASMFTAVVTDHWAVLSPRVEQVNATCEAAHFGLWRLCKKVIYISEADYNGKGCGPISLPGEYNISAAAIAIFSLAFMILGTLCLLCSFKKGNDYILKPAGMFFAFAGLCAIISVEVMRQSVKRMIESEETIWIDYSYAWSFACACAGFCLLFLSGLGLLLLSMPRMPQNPWESCMDAEHEVE
ncbi:voltage-dependent calcium channel gamma-1 subunit isoform X2 [Oncorhynchus mykiss]|uniref:voltage-dependent calcium channel gamma-1 subunit isoform X2 n=1 Tax=Oncorhynchus mykiss TaxID=8022 RepID=UPI0018776207|nr:voltage-dependent calcium channel gamma-1 subunit isoform X2 [Oncorhynchus mykiss]